MKYTVVRERFLTALQKSFLFTSSRVGDTSALRAIFIEAKTDGIILKTTNINEYFITEVGGKVEVEGTLVVDFKTFFEVVKSMSSAKLHVEKKDNIISITDETGAVKIPVLEKGSFPQEPSFANAHNMDKKLFSSETLSAVTFSAATDETRPILTGVCIHTFKEKTNLVTTDGFRLSLLELPLKNEKEEKIIIPSRALLSIQKVFTEGPREVVYAPTERMLRFVGEGTSVYVRLLDGEFPPYLKVVPQSHETRVIFKKEELVNALKTVSLFARESSNMASVSITTDTLLLQARGGSGGEASFSIPVIKKEGSDNKMTFNYRFLLDFVNNIQEDEIIFELASQNAPGLFRIKGREGYLHIIMPIRA